MKTKLKAMIVGVVLAVGIAGAWLYIDSRQDNNQAQTSSEQSSQAADGLTVSDDQKVVSYQGQTGKTALEILKSLADVETQSSSYGEFVTGINGVVADGSTQFWAFYVDGKQASEGAGTYQTSDGQKIEWRIEEVL